MNNALAMNVLNSRDERFHNLTGFSLGEQTFLSYSFEKLAATQILHDYVGVQVVL